MRSVPRLGLAVLLLAMVALPAVPASPKSAPRLPKTSPAVRRWMNSMTLRDKVAQMVFIPFRGAAPNTSSREFRKFVRLVREVKVGGLVLVNWSNGRVVQKAEPYALASFLNRMQRMTRIPLVVSADFERGASMRVEDTTVFPHAMAFGATGNTEFSRYEGEITARESRALGVHWLFYPVADVNNNPDNPIINIRSYGENPQDVSAHVKAFIEGVRSDKRNLVLTTAKHFPGHGDTAVDTHLNLAVIGASRERLEAVELVPFRAAIEAGVDAVMTAHVAVPAVAPADIPATLSPAILTGLLREELGFKGLVVTDALEMASVAKTYPPGEAAVRAIEAGADALVMSPDPDAAIKGVLAAVASGRISQRRIEDSVARLLAAKERLGLDKRRAVTLDSIGDIVSSPESNERAQQIADRAVTLVRNRDGVTPLAEPDRSCFVVMPESRFSTSGQTFTQEVRRRAPRAVISAIDPGMLAPAIDEAIQKLTTCENYVVAAFASVGAYRGTVALSGELPHAMEALIATGKPVVLVALGNPYLLRSFPNVAAYLATFSTVPPSEDAAVKALFGEIEISGRLPVSIPDFAKYGDGITVPARRPSTALTFTQ